MGSLVQDRGQVAAVRSGDPGGMEALSAQVARELHTVGNGEHPRLMGSRREPEEPGWALLEFDVELRTGLVVPISALETEHGFDIEAVAETAGRLVTRADELERQVEEVRSRLERRIEERNGSGVHLQLGCVGLDTADGWENAGRPRFRFDVDALGDDLRRRPHEVQAADADDALAELDPLLVTERKRASTRRALARLGASGTIDQLSLAMIRRHLPLGRTLRELGRHERTWPAEGLTIGWKDGRVRSSGHGFGGLSWDDTTLHIPGASVPETLLTAAVGRPVTALVDHPSLDAGMLIEHAEVVPGDDVEPAALLVRIRTAERLFSAPRGVVLESPRPGRAWGAHRGPQTEVEPER